MQLSQHCYGHVYPDEVFAGGNPASVAKWQRATVRRMLAVEDAYYTASDGPERYRLNADYWRKLKETPIVLGTWWEGVGEAVTWNWLVMRGRERLRDLLHRQKVSGSTEANLYGRQWNAKAQCWNDDPPLTSYIVCADRDEAERFARRLHSLISDRLWKAEQEVKSGKPYRPEAAAIAEKLRALIKSGMSPSEAHAALAAEMATVRTKEEPSTTAGR